MSVRAKFKVQRFESSLYERSEKDASGNWQKLPPIELRTIVLSPVYANGDPNHENTKFWQASPSGEIKLGTVNPEAWKAFELGGEYYVDFTKAE